MQDMLYLQHSSYSNQLAVATVLSYVTLSWRTLQTKMIQPFYYHDNAVSMFKNKKNRHKHYELKDVTKGNYIKKTEEKENQKNSEIQAIISGNDTTKKNKIQIQIQDQESKHSDTRFYYDEDQGMLSFLGWE